MTCSAITENIIAICVTIIVYTDYLPDFPKGVKGNPVVSLGYVRFKDDEVYIAMLGACTEYALSKIMKVVQFDGSSLFWNHGVE